MECEQGLMSPISQKLPRNVEAFFAAAHQRRGLKCEKKNTEWTLEKALSVAGRML